MYSELKYWYLRDHKLFRNLSFAEVDMLCMLRKFKRSKKDERLEMPYSEQPRIYLLKKGHLKLVKIDNKGEEQVLDFLQPGDMFGELSLEQQQTHNDEYFQVLSDEAILCTFYKKDLENLMHKKPDFALSYIRFVGFRYNSIKNSYKNLFFKDAKSRLILFLNSIVEKENTNAERVELPNFLSQNDIAQLVCTTRQTIIKLFKELEEEGILIHQNKKICIKSVPDLQKLAANVK